MALENDFEAVPSIDELVADLGQVVAAGASVSALIRNHQELTALMSLACVQQRSAPEPLDRAQRLVDVLARVVERLPDEGGLRAGVGRLLGTARGYRLVKSGDRRQQAARLLFDPGMSGATFLRRHQQEALTVVAEELLRLEDEFRLRAVRPLLEANAPVFNALAVQWLDQFSYYYRTWTGLNGLLSDLTVYLRRRKRTPNHAAIESYVTSSLWHYARFVHSVGRFVDERGGIWMFSDQSVEQMVADSVYLARWHAPYSELEDSWLVLALLLQYSAPTLVLFENELASADEGRAALDKWSTWLDSCECDLRRPDERCQVHQVARHIRRYCTLVDAEWSRIAGWYRLSPSAITTLDTLSISSAFDEFNVARWEEP